MRIHGDWCVADAPTSPDHVSTFGSFISTDGRGCRAAGARTQLSDSFVIPVQGTAALRTQRGLCFLAPIEDHPRPISVSSFAGAADAAEDEADEAKAESSMSEAELRKALKMSQDAAERALSAAQVAVWTEVLMAFGCIAGFLTSWAGWKMDDSQLPPEMQVPKEGEGLPPELLRPPPSRIRTGNGRSSIYEGRSSVLGRRSSTAADVAATAAGAAAASAGSTMATAMASAQAGEPQSSLSSVPPPSVSYLPPPPEPPPGTSHSAPAASEAPPFAAGIAESSADPEAAHPAELTPEDLQTY
eukprot:gnl/TRDRNA2_/TRDRNA2_34324_c0_seq1.p1 gnl/TRDRNA2_/TRDRNA2_34324_c0~~gnl/TRDRNA2_/TRDRNA2_34324_c0_seq1.p1  ORF type:complete len:301 (-),score=67.57 gnl/TRDRNA2_/TRDRNA2_34324_c0_seq1:45-947(-)